MPRRKKRRAAVEGPQPPKKKRKLWSSESMVKAMDEVKAGRLGVNEAARTYGLPSSTLKDRMKGRVVHGTNPGPKPFLDKEEEKALAEHLMETAQLGYGKTRKQVLNTVERVVREKGNLPAERKRVSSGWFRRFMHRNPDLSLRRGDATAHVRMDCTNTAALTNYFNLLEEYLEGIESPAQIYNMDETGIPLDPRPPNIVTRRGQKKVRYRVSGKKEQITVIGCVNAIGNSIPPMVIFEGKYLNHLWTEHEVPGTYYGMSGKGWTDQELFRQWLKNHFLKYAVPQRPILLLLDGHSSHYEPKSIEIAREEGVILFCLPPHTSHESQPLDSSVFGALKSHWSDSCHEHQQSNPGVVITKYNFNKVFSVAWLRALTPSNIMAGFRKCGVHPFNRDAILATDTHSSSHGSSDATTPSTPPNPPAVTIPPNPSAATTPPNPPAAAASPNSPAVATPSNPPAVPNLPAVATPPGPFSAVTPPGPTPLAFSPDKIERFNRRYDEGYDLPDPEYEAWLKMAHPEAVVSSVAGVFSDVTALDPIGDGDSEILQAETPYSSPEMFPETPSRVSRCVFVPSSVPDSGLSSVSVTPSETPISVSTSATPPSVTGASPVSVSSSTTSSLASPTTSLHNTPVSVPRVSPLSKYLTLPKPVPKVKPTTKTRAITGARVLTSAECFAIIQEQEQKKKQQEENKAKRKQEKEEKKQQREKEKQKKAEERARKAAERARKAEEKEREKERKRAEKTQKEKEKAEKKSKTNEVGGASTSADKPSLRLRSRQENQQELEPGLDDVIEPNRCCVCFEDYVEEEDIEWVKCPCTRWLHEDCIIETVINASGKELLCPHCV